MALIEAVNDKSEGPKVSKEKKTTSVHISVLLYKMREAAHCSDAETVYPL